MTKNFQKINLYSLALFLIFFCSLLCTSCNSTPVSGSPEEKVSTLITDNSKNNKNNNGECDTIHGGEKLPIVKNHMLVVPVRRDSATKGFSTLILLTGEEFGSASLLFRNKQGWQVSKKNQVVFWQSTKEQADIWQGREEVGEAVFDFTHNLKINSQSSFGSDHLMLVIKIPQAKFPNIIIRPGLHPNATVYNYSKPYKVNRHLGAPDGLNSFYQPLRLPLEPEFQLPDFLSKILDRNVTAGDLLYPRLLGQIPTVENSQKADFSLCPDSQ